MPRNTRPLSLFTLALHLAVALAVARPALALPDHSTYDIVLGQAGAGTRRANFTDALGLSGPAAVAIDRAHTPSALYVADQQNARVLAWHDVSQFKPGSAPDLILGQPDAGQSERFRSDARSIGSPAGLAVGPDGTLWVADAANGRVLGFFWPFDPKKTLADRTTADVLIGQADFGMGYPTLDCNGGTALGVPFPPPPSAATLCGPEGVAMDPGGNLYVADRLNHRVVIYAAPIPARGATAATILGQDSATAPGLCNRSAMPATPDAHDLCSPRGLAILPRSGAPAQLYVADSGNNRVLVFDDPNNSAVASRVFGQPSFSASAASGGADRLNAPAAVFLDSHGDVWISDTGGHRVLGFLPPFNPAGNSAAVVIGQPDANSTLPNRGTAPSKPIPLPGATSLYAPRGGAFDAQDRLILADGGNHRVLAFPDVMTPGPATAALGQADLVHGAEDRAKAAGLSWPGAVAVDHPDPHARPGEAVHVYVADTGNSRVLGWRDLSRLQSGKPADLVIGQKGFLDSACNMGRGVTSQALCWPRGVAVDNNGDLWVADTWNHRVVRFPRPFSATQSQGPQTANLVLGQSGFLGGLPNATGSPNPTIRSLLYPAAVVVGDDGMVWVADRDNGRVVGYAAPYQNGMAASRVLAGLDIDEKTPGCPIANAGAYICTPSGLALDGDGNLWVADRDNNRVALFNTTPPDPNSVLLNPVPMAVLGQPDITNGTPNRGDPDHPTATTLRSPEGVTVELGPPGSNGKRMSLYIVVADSGNHRVLVYQPTTSDMGPEAMAVIGQAGAFDQRATNLSPTGFEMPANVSRGLWWPGAVLAVTEGLFISDTGDTVDGFTYKKQPAQPLPGDTGNHRVIAIKGPTFPPNPDAVDMAPPAEDMATPHPDLAVHMQQMKSSGCSCQAGQAGSPPWRGLLLAGLLLGAVLRRRRA